MTEPQFSSDLEFRKKNSKPPIDSEVRVLLRRKRSNYLKYGFQRSMMFHGALVLLFFASLLLEKMGVQMPSLFLDKKNLSSELSKKTIRVDVVDLPTMKLSEMAKVDLTKDAKVAPKKAEPIKPVETSSAQKNKDQMILNEKAKADAKNLENKKLQQAKAKKQKEAEELKQLEDLQKSLTQNYLKDDSLKEVGEGDGGREILAGNVKSQGGSLTGDIATQREAYTAEVAKHFLRHWNAPGWMKASNRFRALILVRVAPDGRVLSQDFLVRSGSAEYDSMAAKAVSDSSPFPRPPADLIRNVMEEGIECGFPE